ncbi:MAG: hypothetical protein KBT58_06975 [Bizionia sp.]|nr:hypothetical protein [Bizionia sp.]
MRKIEDNEILIKEHKNAWKNGILNFETKKIEWDSVLTWTSKMLNPKIKAEFNHNGFSQKIGKARMTFFRYKSQLYFLSENKLIEINNNTKSELKLIGTKLFFSLKQNGETLFEQKHKQIKSIIPIENDPTPYVDEEDFDLRILIHRILSEKVRWNIIFTEKACT